jgi:hypothetical protein
MTCEPQLSVPFCSVHVNWHTMWCIRGANVILILKTSVNVAQKFCRLGDHVPAICAPIYEYDIPFWTRMALHPHRMTNEQPDYARHFFGMSVRPFCQFLFVFMETKWKFQLLTPAQDSNNKPHLNVSSSRYYCVDHCRKHYTATMLSTSNPFYTTLQRLRLQQRFSNARSRWPSEAIRIPKITTKIWWLQYVSVLSG